MRLALALRRIPQASPPQLKTRGVDDAANETPYFIRPNRPLPYGNATRTQWWADLDEPRGSEPGFRRPLLIVQDDAFNRRRIRTVVAAVLTSNLRLVDAPGNVLIPAKASGLPRDSVANVSQIVTIDRDYLREPSGKLRGPLMKSVENGLRLVLSL